MKTLELDLKNKVLIVQPEETGNMNYWVTLHSKDWDFICLGSELTEEIASELVETYEFTIDFIQDNEVDLNDYIEEEKNERRTKDIVGSLHYQTSCILEIIKEGKDKELFAELEKKLDSINI